MKIIRSRLVPNAFALRHTPCDQIQAVRTCLIAAADLAAARQEMEVNYFGLLRMSRAFAPILAANAAAR
jgi:hypothetical protein